MTHPLLKPVYYYRKTAATPAKQQSILESLGLENPLRTKKVAVWPPGVSPTQINAQQTQPKQVSAVTPGSLPRPADGNLPPGQEWKYQGTGSVNRLLQDEQARGLASSIKEPTYWDGFHRSMASSGILNNRVTNLVGMGWNPEMSVGRNFTGNLGVIGTTAAGGGLARAGMAGIRAGSGYATRAAAAGAAAVRRAATRSSAPAAVGTGASAGAGAGTGAASTAGTAAPGTWLGSAARGIGNYVTKPMLTGAAAGGTMIAGTPLVIDPVMNRVDQSVRSAADDAHGIITHGSQELGQRMEGVKNDINQILEDAPSQLAKGTGNAMGSFFGVSPEQMEAIRPYWPLIAGLGAAGGLPILSSIFGGQQQPQQSMWNNPMVQYGLPAGGLGLLALLMMMNRGGGRDDGDGEEYGY